MAGSQRGVNGGWRVLAKPEMPTGGTQRVPRCVDATGFVAPSKARRSGLSGVVRVAAFDAVPFFDSFAITCHYTRENVLLIPI